MILRLSLLALAFSAGQLAAAEPRLARVFSDHMVLQREQPTPVWGWADPGTAVSGTLGKLKATTKAGADGRFELRFAAQPAGGPLTLEVNAGTTKLVRNDVLIGEVWLASGQSNMNYALDKSTGGAEAMAASNLPQLRIFQVHYWSAKQPEADSVPNTGKDFPFVNAEWKVSDPQSVKHVSAVAFHFGRMLNEQLQVPVGIIQAAWHTTPAEPWIPMDVMQAKFPDLVEIAQREEANFDPKADRDALHKQLIAQWEKDRAAATAAGKPVPPWPNKPPDLATIERQSPARLWNGMIHPLVPYAVRGVLWYQGESSAWGAWRYRELFPAMIGGWRKHWGADLPFLFVEIAGWHDKNKGHVEPVEGTVQPVLREAQVLAAQTVPKTAIVSAVDLYDRDNPTEIHPHRKREVAERLILAARSLVYGDKNVVASGPRFAAMKSSGGKAILTFTNVAGGLRAADGGELKGFALAGADKTWRWATATIVGDTVELTCPEVPAPVAAAYNWAAVPSLGNLTNASGLPTPGFRTDTWKRATQP